MRFNRYLSLCGLGSRRGCETLIQEGRVSVNGHVIKDLATQVTDEDRIVADGKPVKAETGVVIALNKPRGYICSRSDERDRMTIYSLLPKQFQTLHHVGRLDKDSEGLLLMTNKGELSHRLIHPSMGAEKEYEVIVDKAMDQTTMAKLVKGMLTEEGHAKCERAWMVTEYRAHVVLKQGLKRQIRLMFYQLGFEVERLTRTRIGWLELKGLQKGGWKQLTEVEVERFFSKDGATGRPSKAEKSARPAAAESSDEEGSRPRTARRSPAGSRGPRAASGRGKGEDRPRSPRSRSTSKDDKPRGPRSRSSFGGGDRPRGPRSRSPEGEDSPRTPRSRSSFGDNDRPSGPRSRSSSGKDDKPRGPRSRSSFGGDDRPRGPRSRAPESEDGPRSRPSFGDSDRPSGPRSRPSFGDSDRPSGPRSRSSFGDDDRPRGPRAGPDKDDEAPRSRGGKRPSGDRKPRSGGSAGRGSAKPRASRGDSPSRPPRASIKRSSDKKGPKRRP